MAGHDDLLKDKKGFLSHGVRDELLIRIDERLGSMQDKILRLQLRSTHRMAVPGVNYIIKLLKI